MMQEENDMKLGKLIRAIRSIATRRNADTVEAIARAAGKGKVADAVQAVEDVVDAVKGR